MTPDTTTAEASSHGPRGAALLAWPLERLLLFTALGLVLVAPGVVGGGDPAYYTTMPVPAVLLVAVTLTALHAWRNAPWTHLAAGVGVSLMPVAIFAIFGLSQISNPLLAREFPGSIILATALLLGLPAGVAGFRRARAGRPHPRVRQGLATTHGRVALAIACVAVGAVAAGAMAADRAGEVAAGASGYDVAPDRTVTVHMRDGEFVPADIAMVAGELTEVVIINEDADFHTLTYEANGAVHNHDVFGGETVRFLTRIDEAGTVPVWCEPHQPDMAGSFLVSEGS